MEAATLNITVGASQLNGGGLSLQFQLTNGNACGANIATLSDFGWLAAGPLPEPLDTAITLNDNGGFLALFTEGLTPGASLTFNLDTSTNFAEPGKIAAPG